LIAVIYHDPDTHRAYTYAQVKHAAKSFGVGLKQLWGWQKGDTLAIYSPNCIDTPAITWGCHWAGGVFSPANPTYTVDELAFQLKNSEAKGLVTQWAFIDIAREAARRVNMPDQRILLIGDARDPSGHFRHFSRLVVADENFDRPKISPDDLAFLVYSSGTTGLPKGVMLTHRNIVANCSQSQAAESNELNWNGGPDGQGDKILAFLPFFHIYGTLRET
jgi:4-coumarate--CoA ligase